MRKKGRWAATPPQAAPKSYKAAGARVLNDGSKLNKKSR